MAERGEGSKQEPKFIKMPEKNEMLGKLKEAGLMGISPQSDEFFGHFVDSVAGDEKVGAGLTMAWALTEYDVLKDYPPVLKGLMNHWFEKVIDTVTPDKEVAGDAKKMMQEAREAASKKK